MSLDLTLNEHKFILDTDKRPDDLIYEFQNYRLDPDHLMLYRGDEEVGLTPKQVETLLALVEKNGEIVSKEALMARLWGDTAVEEANLIQNIHFLRKELGVAPDGRPMIETLRRRGYRFTGQLNTPKNGDADSKTVEAPKPAGEERFQQRPIAIALGVAGLLGVMILASSFLFSSPSVPAAGRTRIAVLPLRPIDVPNRVEIYEVGIADSLIHRLNSIKTLIVRPLSATQNYRAIDQDALAAGREQKVDHVLASNYQVADGKIRITAQLINVANGQIEESYQVETAAENIFSIHDAVADKIGNKLAARFGGTGLPATKVGTSNEDAYRSFLQGMMLFDQRKAAKAIESFERAIALDPNFGRAWAGLALGYKAPTTLPGLNWRDHHERAMNAINRALALDPNIAEAYSAMCLSKAEYEYDFAAAESACKRAIELEPNSALAHRSYSAFLSKLGRHDEAIAAVKAAIDLEPTSYYNQRTYANALYFARRHDEGREQFLRVWELDRNAATVMWMIRNLEAGRRYDEAFRWFTELLKLRDVEEKSIKKYEDIFRERGWQGVLKERVKTNEEGLNGVRLAGVHAQIGDKDHAFELLEQAFEQRHQLLSVLKVDPQFDSIRDDRRYSQLLKRIETK